MSHYHTRNGEGWLLSEQLSHEITSWKMKINVFKVVVKSKSKKQIDEDNNQFVETGRNETSTVHHVMIRSTTAKSPETLKINYLCIIHEHEDDLLDHEGWVNA